MSDTDPSLTPKHMPSQEAVQFLEAVQTSEVRVFEPRDCTPEIFSKDFLADTALAESEGVRTAERVMRAMPGLASVLRGETEPNERTLGAVETLAAMRPIYVQLDDGFLSDDLLLAKDVFEAEDAGMILHPAFVGHPIYGSKFLVFPGLESKGRHFRLMQRPVDVADHDREKVMARALDALTFHSKVKKTGDVLQAIVEYEEDAEVPHNITIRELTDWQRRVRFSGVQLDLDIAPDDESLDNLLRHDGKLYWCDGNILNAKPIAQENVPAEIERHRDALLRFVRK